MPPARPRYGVAAFPIGLSASQSLAVHQAQKRCAGIVRFAPLGCPPDLQLSIKVVIEALPHGNAGVNIINWWDEAGVDVALPRECTLILNSDKIAHLEQEQRLVQVLTHEMLHCLGFGFAWSKHNLLEFPGAGGAFFVGKAATAAYKALLAKSQKSTVVTGVPVETEGGAGQNFLHWSDRIFGTELMTSVQEAGTAGPLSAMTIASLEDLGYGVDPTMADNYRLP